MGMMKYRMEENNEIYGIAAKALERVGVIKTCEIHGYRYIVDELKIQDAYKLGNYWISKGEVDCGTRKLSDAIKKVFDETPVECPGCANVMYDED